MDVFTLHLFGAVYLIGAIFTGWWSIHRAWRSTSEEPIAQCVAVIVLGVWWFIFMPWLGLSKVLKYRRKKNENA